MIDALKSKVNQKLLGELANKIEMLEAEYGTEAGLIGAGYYAMKQVKGE